MDLEILAKLKVEILLGYLLSNGRRIKKGQKNQIRFLQTWSSKLLQK